MELQRLVVVKVQRNPPPHIHGQDQQDQRDEAQASEGEEERYQQRYEGPATQTAKVMKQLWLGILLLVLTGQVEAAAVKNSEQPTEKVKQEYICRSSAAQKLEMGQ